MSFKSLSTVVLSIAQLRRTDQKKWKTMYPIADVKATLAIIAVSVMLEDQRLETKLHDAGR